MKVRLSYGTVGNAEIGDYASMARYENKRLPFGKDMTTIVTLKVWQIRIYAGRNPDNLMRVSI